MSDMDNVFDDEEIEEELKKVEEKEKVDLKDIESVRFERDKLKNEFVSKKKDYKGRIGRLNLHLFGNPLNPDFESKVKVLVDELDDPITQSHPIVPKALDVVRGIKQLQKEFMTLIKFYDVNIEEIGKLLDVGLKLYDKQKEKTDEIEKESKEVSGIKKEDAKITNGMISEFMENYGTKYLGEYLKYLNQGDRMKAGSNKGHFVKFAAEQFRNIHMDSKGYANRLFNEMVRRAIMAKESPKTPPLGPPIPPSDTLPQPEIDENTEEAESASE